MRGPPVFCSCEPNEPKTIRVAVLFIYLYTIYNNFRSTWWLFYLKFCSGVHFGQRKILASFSVDNSCQDCFTFWTLFFRATTSGNPDLCHWYPNRLSAAMLSYVVLKTLKFWISEDFRIHAFISAILIYYIASLFVDNYYQYKKQMQKSINQWSSIIVKTTFQLLVLCDRNKICLNIVPYRGMQLKSSFSSLKYSSPKIAHYSNLNYS